MGTRIMGILLVLLSTSIEAVGQVSLKQSEMVSNAVRSRLWTVFGVACLGVEAIVWTIVLTKLEVSIAFPMGSLCFVTVFILSILFLKEKPNGSRWTGVLFILCGTALLGAS
jgi:undecaprenyl phosphate-alpha-L-ara4N flippase subunit ArnE